MRFRLAVYHTSSANKFDASRSFEYFGDSEAIWALWFHFAREMGLTHVEVYSLDGRKLNPEAGVSAMVDYQL
jgi:hypothetical protein